MTCRTTSCPRRRTGLTVGRPDRPQAHGRARRGRLLRPAVRDHAASSAIRSATRRSTGPACGRPEVLRRLLRHAERDEQRAHGQRVLDGADARPDRHPDASRPSGRTGCRARSTSTASTSIDQAAAAARPATPATASMERDADALWRADRRRRHPSSSTSIAAHLRRLRRDDGVAGVRRDEVPDQGGRPGRSLGQPRPDQAELGHEPLRAVDVVARRRAAVGHSSIRQGESSGTITHEIVHTFGVGDNNNNPYVTPYRRVGSGPWDVMDRGSFNGPGGPHMRWVVPAHAGRRDARRHDAAQQDRHGLHLRRAGGARQPRRAGELRPRRSPTCRASAHGRARRAGTLTGHPVASTVPRRRPDAGLRHQHRPAVRRRAGCNYYSLETVQRIGDDSFTPDNGVLIAKNKTARATDPAATPASPGSIDANPQDMNKVDFLQARTTRRSCARSPTTASSTTRCSTPAPNSGSQYEYVDAANRLHFYVLDRPARRERRAVVRRRRSARSTARARTRAASRVARRRRALNPRRQLVHVQAHQHRRRRATDRRPAPAGRPTASFDTDVYRLSARRSRACRSQLTNALAAVKSGEQRRRPGLHRRPRQPRDTVTLTATSESDPTKTATAPCAWRTPATSVARCRRRCADAGHAGRVRPVHAGRRERLHRLDDGQRRSRPRVTRR